MSIICESGVGHAVGEFVQSIITVSMYEKMPKYFKGVASIIGWISHEMIVEPMIDASICYPDKVYYAVNNFIYNPISIIDDLTENVCSMISINNAASFLTTSLFTNYNHQLLYNNEHIIASFAKLIPINMFRSYGIKQFYDYLLLKSNIENNNSENSNLYPYICVNNTTELSVYSMLVIEKCYSELD